MSDWVNHQAIFSEYNRWLCIKCHKTVGMSWNGIQCPSECWLIWLSKFSHFHSIASRWYGRCSNNGCISSLRYQFGAWNIVLIISHHQPTFRTVNRLFHSLILSPCNLLVVKSHVVVVLSQVLFVKTCWTTIKPHLNSDVFHRAHHGHFFQVSPSWFSPGCCWCSMTLSRTSQPSTSSKVIETLATNKNGLKMVNGYICWLMMVNYGNN